MIPSAVPKQFKPSTGEMVVWGNLIAARPCGYGSIILTNEADFTTAAAAVLSHQAKQHCPLASLAGRRHVPVGSTQVFKMLDDYAVLVTGVETVSGPRDHALLHVHLLQRLTKLTDSHARAEALHLTGCPTMIA
jgi:hypothetical protein